MKVDQLNTRLATYKDLSTLANIHKRAYSQKHFTSLLSEKTLARYYSYFLGDGCQIMLALKPGVSGDEEILGFAVYGSGVPERISAFKREAWFEIFRTSLQHPIIATKKAINAVASRLQEKLRSTPAEFLLLSIAVSELGKGVGNFLLRNMLRDAYHAGHTKIGLYVNADNIRALNSYFSSGFILKNISNMQFYMEYNFARGEEA